MYVRGRYERGISKKTFQYMLVGLIALAVLSLFLLLRLTLSSTSDTRLQDVLIEQARIEEENARLMAAQISRTGGANTMINIAKTRQHLYAISKINNLSVSLVTGGQALVRQETLDTCFSLLDQCITRITSSVSIEVELNALWVELTEITKDIEALL